MFGMRPAKEGVRGGTKIICILKDEQAAWNEQRKLRALLDERSEQVGFPVGLYVAYNVDREEDVMSQWRRLNDEGLLWMENLDPVTCRGYEAFYQSLSREWEDYLDARHYCGGGPRELRVMIFDYFDKARKDICIGRVFIMSDGDELASLEWHSFVEGVTGWDGLPLRVSYEALLQPECPPPAPTATCQRCEADEAERYCRPCRRRVCCERCWAGDHIRKCWDCVPRDSILRVIQRSLEKHCLDLFGNIADSKYNSQKFYEQKAGGLRFSVHGEAAEPGSLWRALEARLATQAEEGLTGHARYLRLRALQEVARAKEADLHPRESLRQVKAHAVVAVTAALLAEDAATHNQATGQRGWLAGGVESQVIADIVEC